MRVLILLCALLVGSAARADQEMPIFDAHLHYSHDAWQLVPPQDFVDILKKARDLEPMMPDTYGFLGELYTMLGVDRWAALLSDHTNIREVMAFPKTQSGGDLMLEAPSEPDPAQYAELGLRFVGVEKAAGKPAAG